jgi:hypothetical protein
VENGFAPAQEGPAAAKRFRVTPIHVYAVELRWRLDAAPCRPDVHRIVEMQRLVEERQQERDREEQKKAKLF